MITPFGKYILVQEPKLEELKTKTGILLPKSQDNRNLVDVVAVGEKVEKCTVGDRLLVDKRRLVNEYIDNGEIYKFVLEDDCYAKI